MGEHVEEELDEAGRVEQMELLPESHGAVRVVLIEHSVGCHLNLKSNREDEILEKKRREEAAVRGSERTWEYQACMHAWARPDNGTYKRVSDLARSG